jgi:hypothetical protein
MGSALSVDKYMIRRRPADSKASASCKSQRDVISKVLRSMDVIIHYR